MIGLGIDLWWVGFAIFMGCALIAVGLMMVASALNELARVTSRELGGIKTEISNARFAARMERIGR